MGLPPWSMTLKGHDWTSFLTVSSSNRRPIRRLRQSACCVDRVRRDSERT
jgi:hypothetical protein